MVTVPQIRTSVHLLMQFCDNNGHRYDNISVNKLTSSA